MKTQIKKLLLILGAASMTSACTSVSKYTLDTDFDSAPVKTKTKMSEALQCLSGELEKNLTNPSAYVFMVRDIIDGTIKHNNYSDGPLSDSGRIQMISTLSAHTNPGYGLVIDQFPIMFKPVINEQVGLDRYGLPSESNLENFLPKLTSVANANRSAKGMPEVSTVTPLVIDGAFTRNDSSHQRSKGYGQNGGYRGDVENEESAAIDFGKSGSERSVTLVINIIDPKTNVVIGTEGFDLKYYSNSKTARFRVAIDNYYYGFSNTDVRVETLHAAQQTLLDGAAVWILDNAFGSKVDFSPCFDTQAKIALGRDSRGERLKAEQIELAKQKRAPKQNKPVAAQKVRKAEAVAKQGEPVVKRVEEPKSAPVTEPAPASVNTAQPVGLIEPNSVDANLFDDELKDALASNVAVGCTYQPNGKWQVGSEC